MVDPGEGQHGLSALERLDLALASRFVAAGAEHEAVTTAERVLANMRRPSPDDGPFLAALLRLRGFVVTDHDAADVLADRATRLSPLSQEHRMIRGLAKCLAMVRQRAAAGQTPDGWFLVELFKAMTGELPRFRNNELRREVPWDALLYVRYPGAEELRYLLDTFDEARCYRDIAMVWNALHPTRQGFRLMWRFARIAPFPDFNLVMAWLAMNAWLLAKGYPMVAPDRQDQQFLSRLVSGPPPTKIVQYEGRLLAMLGGAA